MTQLFQNLLANALKFRSERPLKISVRATEQEAAWLFAVEDNGIGFDMKFATDIFDLFRQLHLRQQYGGTGMGLTICKRIVTQHQGHIWFDSQIGQGTTCFFTLPKSEAGKRFKSHLANKLTNVPLSDYNRA